MKLAYKEQPWKNKTFSFQDGCETHMGTHYLCTHIPQSLMKRTIYLSSRRYFWYLCYLRQSWISIGGRTYSDGNITQISWDSLKTYGNENVQPLWERWILFPCFIPIFLVCTDFKKVIKVNTWKHLKTLQCMVCSNGHRYTYY